MFAPRKRLVRGDTRVTYGCSREAASMTPAESVDGFRGLVGRLWPRGISRERAALDSWEKELAPSTQLRRWFAHEPSRFEEFRWRYVEELRMRRPQLAALRRHARHDTLTLVCSAHNSEHNQAVVLAEVLRRGLPKGRCAC